VWQDGGEGGWGGGVWMKNGTFPLYRWDLIGAAKI